MGSDTTVVEKAAHTIDINTDTLIMIISL